MDYACSQCGNRQERDGSCARCRSDHLHDLRSRRSRELLEDIEIRLRDTREGQLRGIAVVGSMVAVFALWMIPGYSTARAVSFALPFFLDQIAFMVVIAFGILKVLEPKLMRKRFPYLDQLPPPTQP